MASVTCRAFRYTYSVHLEYLDLQLEKVRVITSASLPVCPNF